MHGRNYELITFTLTTGHKTKHFLSLPQLPVSTSTSCLLLNFLSRVPAVTVIANQPSGCMLHHLRDTDGPLEPTEPP